jgi:hypothetical protein
VTLGVFDANLHDVRMVRHHMTFGDGEAPIAGLHLNAVIRDAEADGEPERL